MRDVCIVGVGKLGGALAIALSNAGWNVKQLVVRSDRSAKKIKARFISSARIAKIRGLNGIDAPIVLITVGDPEIRTVAQQLSGYIGKQHIVFHSSGSISSAELSVLRERDAAVGSIHPLASISDPFEGAGQFKGRYFCVEGDRRAVNLGKRIVRSLGGSPFSIEAGSKALYHAAAVSSAGHVTALFASALEMMSFTGLDLATAKKILLPLLQSTISNLERQKPSRALTGTFARLDVHTFERHLSSFNDLPRELVHLYLELGERSLDLVEERDGPSERLQEFRKIVSVAKRKFKC